MKKRGISILGIIVFLGVIALIVWGLNYIITKDFVVVRTPTPAVPTNPRAPIATSTTVAGTSTTPVTTPVTKPTATSTPVTTPATPKPTETPAPSTTSTLTVTYTDKGFSPSSLTVKKGQTVKFVNESSGKLWVAANPFPTSSEYPAFNQKVSITNGASWSFTFDKTGVWFYHNHNNPPLGGKIVVNAK